jgi:hypothetical protein
MEHAKILGVSSAHVWNRAKKLRSERKELNGELESILTDGEACFSHSYMSAILSAFPTQQDSVQNETILDIFDSELEKIKKMEVEGENSTLHICTIRDSIRRITTKLPDGVRSKFPVFARGK